MSGIGEVSLVCLEKYVFSFNHYLNDSKHLLLLNIKP